jgi:hypothetical protein
MDRPLLEDYLPTTAEIGFLEAELEAVRCELVDWHRSIAKQHGYEVISRDVQGALPDLLQALLPLTSLVACRWLLVPTRSRWTAYFDNGWGGTDAFGPMSYLAKRMGVRGVRAVVDPPEQEGRLRRTRGHGALMVEVYGAAQTDWLNVERSVSLMREDRGGPWLFEQTGTPLPAEDPAAYSAGKIADALSIETVARLLASLDIDALNQDFYAPDRRAELVERKGNLPPDVAEYSFAEAQTDL